jgi:hypothetical protein
MMKDIRKLSGAQLHALDLASRYKLQWSSMGWWAVASDGSALSDPVEILAPNTIRSLWRLGLLDGNPDPLPPVDRPSLWANERARKLLTQIAHDIDWSELSPEWSPTTSPETRKSPAGSPPPGAGFPPAPFFFAPHAARAAPTHAVSSGPAHALPKPSFWAGIPQRSADIIGTTCTSPSSNPEQNDSGRSQGLAGPSCGRLNLR